MAATVKRVKLGSQGLEVSAQGLGCMGMSAFYGPPKPEPEMIALIHHAINSGVTFLDTSDIYGPFTNEILLGKVRKLYFLFKKVFFFFGYEIEIVKSGGIIRRSKEWGRKLSWQPNLESASQMASERFEVTLRMLGPLARLAWSASKSILWISITSIGSILVCPLKSRFALFFFLFIYVYIYLHTHGIGYNPVQLHIR